MIIHIIRILVFVYSGFYMSVVKYYLPVLTSFAGRDLTIKLLINTHKEPAMVTMGTKQVPSR